MKVIKRKSPFIRQFSGPGNNNIICFKFWQAIVASGCPGECSYCFLQTQHPYRKRLYDLKGTIFENLIDIVKEARRWLKRFPSAGLIIGENQDALAFEKSYKKLLGFTPLELLIPLFNNENPFGHTLIILSKFTNTEYAEKFGPSPNVVFSWSLSFPTISRKYEKKVSPLEKRLKKSAELKNNGHRIRFRLDTLAPIHNWQLELVEIMKEINKIKPEMLTIGALRATNPKALRNAALKNNRNSSIFNYIETIDPSGFKYRTNNHFQIQAFKHIKKLLDPQIKLGLCKEDKSIWSSIKAKWQGCNCLHNTHDLVAIERMKRKKKQSIANS